MVESGEVTRHAPIYRRSGGIGYHLVALRYAGNLWRAYRDTLSEELLRRFRAFGSEAKKRPLVVIGGHLLAPARRCVIFPSGS